MPAVSVHIADAMRTAGYVPADRKALTAGAKAKLAGILSRGISSLPDEVPAPRGGVGVQLWLSSDDAELLGSLGAPAGLDLATTASALLQLDFQDWFRINRPVVTESASLEADANLGALGRALARQQRTARAEQTRFLAALRTLCDLGERKNAVLFAEAGTGIGKTSTYLGFAVDFLAQNQTARCMIAAPTFALLAQLEAELVAYGEDAPASVILAGQNEWVSSTALSDFLSNSQATLPADQLSAMGAWAKTGGLTGDEPRWSVNSLLAVVPDFAHLVDVTLLKRVNDDDAGWHAYQLQFERAASARLVIMTHSMLAWLVRRRLTAQASDLKGNSGVREAVDAWRELNQRKRTARDSMLIAKDGKNEDAFEEAAVELVSLNEQSEYKRFHEALNAAFQEAGSDAGCDRLPDADLLIVDEAHALEDTFAQVFCTHESMNGLLGAARSLQQKHARVIPPDSTSQLEAVNARLKAMGASRGPDDMVPIEVESHLISEISDALLRTCQPRPGASKVGVGAMTASPEARRLTRVASALALVKRLQQGGASFLGAILHWSPHKDFPRLTVGKRSLEREFHYLWTVVATRTALVSGTLYEEIPTYSCTTIARALAIPPSLTLTMEPIHAQWQRDPVELQMIADVVDVDGRKRFARPSYKLSPPERERANNRWVADIASYVRGIAGSKRTAGGVLIVGTAFSDIHAVAAELGDLGERWVVLVQKPGTGLAGFRQEFLEASRTRRAMLLAVGSAWTGFDLYSPQTPEALTDLVVLNAPFGTMGATLPRLRRQAARAGHFDVAAHALVLVRQVVGRLVRSPDTPHNRKIHWLDARIHDKGMKGMMYGIVRFLGRYRMITASVDGLSPAQLQ